MTASENQIKAITHQLGPCMVLAGPGSGKTFTIIHRIKYLLKSDLVRPDQILVVTFTRDAATQMRERFMSLMQESGEDRYPHACEVVFGTFHSVFFNILKENRSFQNAGILTDKEKKRMVSSLIPAEITKRFDSRNEYEDYLMCMISEIERERISEETDESFTPLIDPVLYRSVSDGYKQEKMRRGKIDFTDILLECRILLQSDPVLLEKWRKRFRFFLVDEFQDINAVQYDILRILAYPYDNLFAVGDDDQAIYSFRGSSPSFMIRFSEMFPNSRQIVLDTNFRSAGMIVMHSGKLIRHNRHRLKKKMKSAKGDDGKLVYHRFGARSEQYEWIAEYLKTNQSSGTAAVLTRTHRQLERIASELEDCSLKFCLKNTKSQAGNHFLTNDLKAYANMIISAGGKFNRRDLIQVFRTLDIPVPRDLLDEEVIDPHKLLKELKDQSWLTKLLQEFFKNLLHLSHMPPYVGLRFIAGKMNYSAYASRSARDHHADPEITEKLLDKVIERAKNFTSWEEWLAHTNDSTYSVMSDHQSAQKIILMTMHASKGLEFDTVIIPDLVEGLTPRHGKNEEMEEERRLVYVAMTRAKKNLILTAFCKSGMKAMPLSRFIQEAGIT